MRRTTPILAAVAALALAAPAGGASADLTAPSADKRGGFFVEVDVTYRNGKPRTVDKFKFKNVVVTCESGPEPNPFTTDSKKPHFGPMSVNRKGRFSRVFSNNGQNFNGNVVIRGEFITKHKLEGTLKIKGDYPNRDYEGCATGKVEWTLDIA